MGLTLGYNVANGGMDPNNPLERNMNHSDRELALIANTDVLGFIRARNAELKAQAEAEGWQLLMMPCESLADEYANVYEYLHCGAASQYSGNLNAGRDAKGRGGGVVGPATYLKLAERSSTMAGFNVMSVSGV